MALVHIDAGITGNDCCALLGDAGADAINVKVNIDAISDGLVMAVLHDKILIEETDRLARRRGGEADEERIEIKQSPAPTVRK